MRAPASFPYPLHHPREPSALCCWHRCFRWPRALLPPPAILSHRLPTLPMLVPRRLHWPTPPSSHNPHCPARPHRPGHGARRTRRWLPFPGGMPTSSPGRLGRAPNPPHPRPPSKSKKAPTVITTGTTAAAAAAATTASPLHPRRCTNATTHREASHEPPRPNAAHFSTPFPTPVPAPLPAGRCSCTGRLRQCLARWPAR